jgi:hypothetical protein
MIYWELFPEWVWTSGIRKTEVLKGLLTGLVQDNLIHYPIRLHINKEEVMNFKRCDKNELKIIEGYIQVYKPFVKELLFTIDLNNFTIYSNRFMIKTGEKGYAEVYFNPKELGYCDRRGFAI